MYTHYRFPTYSGTSVCVCVCVCVCDVYMYMESVHMCTCMFLCIEAQLCEYHCVHVEVRGHGVHVEVRGQPKVSPCLPL